jgi:hypothetical protein
MSTTAQILAAQQKTLLDLTTLQSNTTALITAFANGTISPADAATILANSNAEDTDVGGLNTSIQTALTAAAPPTPVTGPPTSGTGAPTS